MFRTCGAFLTLLLVCVANGRAGLSAERGVYRHAYYLFLSSTPRGCEACYVPLLLTAQPLEVIAAKNSDTRAVLIITYERDSIWQNPAFVSVDPSKIEPDRRSAWLHVDEMKAWREYRYQKIEASEAIALLEKPEGKIPIHRLGVLASLNLDSLNLDPPGREPQRREAPPSLVELIAGLRGKP